MSNENDAPMQGGPIEVRERSKKPHDPSWMCKAHRGDGELCRKAAVRAGVCLTHGAAAPQVIAKHKRELEEKLPKVSRTLDELLDDVANPQVRLGAVKEVHDRVLGRPGDTGKGGDNRPLIQIGIGLTMTPGDLSQLTVVESRAELPAGVEVIDAEPAADDADD